MKERPIIFSAPMVREILAGRKTQTRRILKMPKKLVIRFPLDTSGEFRQKDGLWQKQAGRFNVFSPPFPCPYGIPDDRLWVRETWHPSLPMGIEVLIKNIPEEYKLPLYVDYRADMGDVFQKLIHWESAMFMPRWASRLTLEITDVRVQRVQDITEEDAEAEGAMLAGDNTEYGDERNYWEGFRDIWQKINGQESWDANPWVWSISFRRITNS